MDIQISQIRKPIEEELAQFDELYQSLHKSSFDLIETINKYILERRGKQMRSITILLVAKMLGVVNQSTYIAGTVLELLHNASLLHDDVIDETMERRGEASVNALWTSKEAVLMGDYLLSQGLVLASETNNLGILKIASRVGKELSEGELIQTSFAHNMQTTESTYYEIIKRKTAILFSSCSKAGALTVNASEQDIENMEQFGHALGMAFQIKDDIFDYQFDTSIGKPIGNDLKEQKLTLPILYLMDAMNAEERKELVQFIRENHEDESAVRTLVQRVIDEGGVEYSKGKMRLFMEQALDTLKRYPDSPVKTALIDLVHYTIERPL